MSGKLSKRKVEEIHPTLNIKNKQLMISELTFTRLDKLCKDIIKTLLDLSAELNYNVFKDPAILSFAEEAHKEIDECSDHYQLYQFQQTLMLAIKFQQQYYIQQGHADAMNKIIDEWRTKNQAMNAVVVKLLY